MSNFSLFSLSMQRQQEKMLLMRHASCIVVWSVHAEACILISKVLACFQEMTMASWQIFKIQLPTASTRLVLMGKTPGWCLPMSLKMSWTGTISLLASTLWQMSATRDISASTTCTACTGNHPRTLQMEVCIMSPTPCVSMLPLQVICFQFPPVNFLVLRVASPLAWKMWPSLAAPEELPWQLASIAWMVALVVPAMSNIFWKMWIFQARIDKWQCSVVLNLRKPVCSWGILGDWLVAPKTRWSFLGNCAGVAEAGKLIQHGVNSKPEGKVGMGQED